MPVVHMLNNSSVPQTPQEQQASRMPHHAGRLPVILSDTNLPERVCLAGRFARSGGYGETTSHRLSHQADIGPHPTLNTVTSMPG